MGRALLGMVRQRADTWTLVGALESSQSPWLGRDAGTVDGQGALNVLIAHDVSALPETCEVLVEFSSPVATVDHLRHAIAKKIPMVIGTTGFTQQEYAEVVAMASDIPCVMASNMSPGVNVLLALVEQAALSLKEFDVEIIESHHRDKKDAPSGTAKALLEAVRHARGNAVKAVNGREGLTGARTRGEVGLHAVRAGNIVGDHRVLLAGPHERLELSHHAESREVFAEGALRAAQFVVSAPPGLHSMREVLGL